MGRTSRCAGLCSPFVTCLRDGCSCARARGLQAQVNLAVVLLYSAKLDEVRSTLFCLRSSPILRLSDRLALSLPVSQISLRTPHWPAPRPQAITHLQSLLASHPLASHHSPALLFNLSTLYELRSERAQDDKVRLLVAAAACGGGAQGVEAGAFKLAL